MSYRVIALDLDGTLLTPDKTILPQSIAALNRARQAGLKVIIATGRHHSAIHPFYQALALDTPAICCNGTYLYDYHAEKVLLSTPLSHNQAHKVLDLLEQESIHGLLYADDAMYYQHNAEYIHRSLKWIASLPAHQRPRLIKVDDLRQTLDEVRSVWKFAISHDASLTLQQFAESVRSRLGLTCEWSWHNQVDVAQTGNSKGKRLAEWVEMNGYHMQDVVAFGDNYNDLSMLENVGLGIAMGNADAEIRARAKQVIGPNTEPGIAGVIEQLLR